MKTACFVFVLALCCLSGCSTPGSEYAKAHPELSPAHRQILTSGKVPGGLAVEGMTREQVRLALGNPVTVETFNIGEGWVYIHGTSSDGGAGMGGEHASGPGPQGRQGPGKPGDMGPRRRMIEKTTVFFQGDRATQTRISKERE